MLLRAHLERESDEVAPILQPDLKFVLSKTPILLEEMIKVGVVCVCVCLGGAFAAVAAAAAAAAANTGRR